MRNVAILLGLALALVASPVAGGHMAKMRQEMANAQTQLILATVLGVGAMVAGAKTGGASGSAGQIGMAALSAPQEIIRRSLLSYVRAQEEQADKAGVKFLTATGQSAKGMYDTFKRLADQTMFTARGVDPYVQTHPMPIERVHALEEIARTSQYWDKKDSPELQARHDMMLAKLSGFMDRPDTIARRYPLTDTSLPARYTRAISAYRFGDPRSAMAQIDSLIQAMPNNAYFYELKGQALLEGGHPADAIAPLRHAAQLAPNPALIQILLAQALVATNDAKSADEAISLLHAAVSKHAGNGIKLDMIDNRGVIVWPAGLAAADTFCTDSFRCRFFLERTADPGNLPDLARRISQSGVDVVMTASLRTCDGREAYSLAQGQ